MMLLRQSTHRMLMQYHPRIGHLYVPNVNARIPNESGGYFARTNSLGFRSDTEFVRARQGRARLLLFGDSYTAGDGCDNRQRFSDRLAEELDAEVYNYGLSGSGTDQQLLIFEEFARGVEADAIVLCVTVENIQRIKARYRESIDRASGLRVLVPKPYFTLDAGRLQLHHVPVPFNRPDAKSFPVTNGRRGSPWLERSVELYRTAPWLKGVRESVRSRFHNLQGRILRHTGFQPYPDYASPHDGGWALMRSLIERFHEGAYPVPLLVVPIPNYFFYLHRLKPLYQSLFDSLDDPSNGLHVLNVTERLAQMPDDARQRLSFRKDSHFSPFGHEQVAQLLKEDITRRNVLPRRAPGSRSIPRARRQPLREPTYVLGLSCFYHNSAAALIKDGRIVAAAEEERFSRIKNDRGFPHHASNYCLEEAGIHQDRLSAVVYYDNASMTFERIMHTFVAIAPGGADAWVRVMPSWLRYKVHLPGVIRSALCYDGLLLQERHHRSHAASAFYPSPFERAAVLTIDGVGEWATASIGLGAGHHIELLREMCFPHSLGLLYSAFTQFTGFQVNEGEYKLMGLAPYGEPRYVDTILKQLVELKDDGSVELNLEYFAFLSGSTMTNQRFADLFGGPPRSAESPITRREMDLARSIQVVIEEAILRMARHAHTLTGARHLCMAGGVALNCVANGRLHREGPFDDIWIQPAAGDAGGALGAALDVHYNYFADPDRTIDHTRARQGGSYWGPQFGEQEVRAFLDTHALPHRILSSAERAETIAGLLEQGKVVGHFAGRMEFGPRSLGARSILGDARNPEMQVNLNLKIKYRESFRPFAPTVLSEKAGEYFELDKQSPYMLLVAPVKAGRRKPFKQDVGEGDLLPLVRQERSDIPAVTHVDYSARVQTITRDDHPLYYELIQRFERDTGCAVIVNTSFNVRGEPIVCTPYDAYRCFMRTDMDVLVLGHCLLLKAEQPAWSERNGHMDGPNGKTHSSQPDALITALRRIYEEDFTPLAISLRKLNAGRVCTSFKRMASTWSEATPDQSPLAVFALPEGIDRANPDPETLARAITAAWTPGQATEALRPLTTTLIRLGQQFSASDIPQEEVSGSVYVMF